MTPAPQRISGNGRPIPTHCLRGHPYNEANTYWRTDGTRACHVCRRAQKKQRRRARKGDAHLSRDKAKTPLVVRFPDGLMNILAHVAKLALEDYANNVPAGPHPSAEAFLRSAGLLLPDGSIDTRGMHQTPRKERTK